MSKKGLLTYLCIVDLTLNNDPGHRFTRSWNLMPGIEGMPPIVDANSRVLVLGSMPGQESLQKQQYYANPRNQFWPVIYAIFKANLQITYAERVASMFERRMALWDVVQTCQREGSADSKIAKEVPNDLESFLNDHPNIQCIFFNGQKAYQIFMQKFKPESFGELTLQDCLLPVRLMRD
jgi:hypoxanthine-DNA glycosylase